MIGKHLNQKIGNLVILQIKKDSYKKDKRRSCFGFQTLKLYNPNQCNVPIQKLFGLALLPQRQITFIHLKSLTRKHGK